MELGADLPCIMDEFHGAGGYTLGRDAAWFVREVHFSLVIPQRMVIKSSLFSVSLPYFKSFLSGFFHTRLLWLALISRLIEGMVLTQFSLKALTIFVS